MEDHDKGHALLILGIKPKGKAAHGGVMSKEEKKKHGAAAMKEMHAAMQKGDHEAMSAAMRAHAAIHDDDDAEEYEDKDGPDAMPEGPSSGE